MSEGLADGMLWAAVLLLGAPLIAGGAIFVHLWRSREGDREEETPR